MAKKSETVEAQQPTAESKSDRQRRWEKHVENYKLKNPVKGAAKEKRGEFKEIPETFV